MTVVVDVGCASRGEWESLRALQKEYRPKILYGFDPSPQTESGIGWMNGTRVKIRRAAAWTYTGTVTHYDQWLGPQPDRAVGFGPKTFTGKIGVIGEGNIDVRCIDFAAWLEKHGPAVVKMDIEGAEYVLLRHLIDRCANELITELIIEWHDHEDTELVAELGCPVRSWWM